MRDNEIINALGCCIGKSDCLSCPCEKGASIECLDDLHRYALDLIYRQKVEIERLNAEADKIAEDYSNLMIEKDELFDEAEKLIKKAKAEAVKEFAERLKENFNNLEYNARTTRKTVKTDELREQMDWVLHMVAPKTIDNLVKEMVGES